MQETHLTFKSPFGELSKALLTSLFVAIVGTGIVAIFSATDLSTSLDGNMANSFLATVAQITAAIVAIVFTISTLTISVVSDRYSSQLMSKFIYDPITITTFFIQLFCAALATIAIGVNIPMYQIGFLGMVWLFIFSLAMLLFYLVHSLSLISPQTFAQVLVTEGKQALMRKDEEKFELIISSLGDICLKAFTRKEDSIARIYLKALSDLHEDWDNHKRTNEEKKQTLEDLLLGESSPVFSQYERILKAFAADENSDLCITISNLASSNLKNSINILNNTKHIKQLFFQYNQMFEIVTLSKDVSRFNFIYRYREVLFYEVSIQTSDTPVITSSGLISALLLVLKHEDTELWKHTLDYFLSGAMNLNQLSSSIEYLFKSNRPNSYALRQLHSDYINQLFPLEPRIWAHEMCAKGPNPQSLEMIKHHSATGRKNQAIIYAFFKIGFEAFKSSKYDYLRQLWTPGNTYPYLNLVPQNLLFASFMLLRFFRAEVIMTLQEPIGSTRFHQYMFIFFACSFSRAESRSVSVPRILKEELKGDVPDIEKWIEEQKYFRKNLKDLPSIVEPLLEGYTQINLNVKEYDALFSNNADVLLHEAADWLRTNPFKEWENFS